MRHYWHGQFVRNQLDFGRKLPFFDHRQLFWHELWLCDWERLAFQRYQFYAVAEWHGLERRDGGCCPISANIS